jgi:hypothetical protein
LSQAVSRVLRRVGAAAAVARALAPIVTIGALASALPVTAGEPPPRDDLCPRDEGCLEQCGLADTTTETPSPLFLEKLTSIAPTKHHIDTVYGTSRLERIPWFRIVNVPGLPPEAAARWQHNRRYAGPCAGLVAVFHSKAAETESGGQPDVPAHLAVG